MPIPLRGSKWNLYEGGVRVPLLVSYPGVVPANSVCSTPVIQTDFFATFRELATGETGGSADGTSYLPLLKGTSSKILEDRSLYWHFPYYHPEGKSHTKVPALIGTEDGYISATYPQSALRKGKYKLLYFYEDKRTELYDLDQDIEENNDLSKSRPETAARLRKDLLGYLEKVKARLPREK